jgi:hypothetical protein
MLEKESGANLRMWNAWIAVGSGLEFFEKGECEWQRRVEQYGP